MDCGNIIDVQQREKRHTTNPTKGHLRTLFCHVIFHVNASDGDLAPYTLHADDDVQESEPIGEVGENEKDGDGGETSVWR